MWGYLFTNLLNGIMAILLLIGAYRIFEIVTYRIDFYAELENGNYAVAGVICAFLLGLSLIISAAAY